MENLSQKIRELRDESNLTQAELARNLGITQDSISLWEKGKRIPDTVYIVKLAQFFDVSTDYLLGVEEDFGATIKPRANSSATLPLDETELLEDYRALSYTGKARVVAYADLLREQESGANKNTGRK